MKRVDNSGQVWYFTSVMLVFVGFLFFGIFLLSNNSLTGSVVSNVNLQEGCDDSDILSVWDSVFWESSSGVSILKDNTLIGGYCAEFFANKTLSGNPNRTYILYGYTVENAGKNTTYIFAENLNATGSYFSDFLNNLVSIDDVSTYALVKDNSFFGKYVNLRNVSLASYDAQNYFNNSFEMNQSEAWSLQSYLGNDSYVFSNNFSNNNFSIYSSGIISSGYNYAGFNLSLSPLSVSCTESFECGDWSDCIDGEQNRTCLNSSNCYNDFNSTFVRSCVESVNNCTSLWNWSNWSDCNDGIRTRTVWDENDCGNDTGKPSSTLSCGVSCVSDWVCGDWEPSACPSNGFQQRTCTDSSVCNASNALRIENQTCNFESSELTFAPEEEAQDSGNSVLFVVVLVVLFLIVGAVLVGLVLIIKKKDGGDDSLSGSSSNVPPINPPSPARRIASVAPSLNSVKKKVPFVATKPLPKIVPNPVVNNNVSQGVSVNVRNRKSFPRFRMRKIVPVRVQKNFGNRT